MSSRSTYFIVDIIPEDSENDVIVSQITYNYLINPIVNAKSNKISLIKYENKTSTPLSINHKVLDWSCILNFISQIRKPSTSYDPDYLFDLIANLLTLLIDSSNKNKQFDIIIISKNLGDYSKLEKRCSFISDILKQYPFINLVYIDSFDNFNDDNLLKIHDSNISLIKSIFNDDENLNVLNVTPNSRNFFYNISEINLNKFSNCIPKLKKPVEIYSGSLQLLNFENLSFNISAYTFVKKNSFSDYLSFTSIDKNSESKLNYSYDYTYFDPKNDEEKKFDNNNSYPDNKLFDCYKFGSSNLFLTSSNFYKNQNTNKSLKIASFVPLNTIPPWYLKEDSLIIFPSKKLIDKDNAMFAELWYSMKRLKTAAIVRLIKRSGSDIKYGVLIPQNYIDDYTEISGQIDFGCFILIETIFKDDEKLVNLPNLYNIKIENDIQNEIDTLIDDFSIDNEENDSIYESNSVSMNNVIMNDMFFYIRSNLTKVPEKGNNKVLANTITMALRNHKNPLLSYERLIYLITFLMLLSHLNHSKDAINEIKHDDENTEEEITQSLYQIYKQEGFPKEIVDRWLQSANGVFFPYDLLSSAP